MVCCNEQFYSLRKVFEASLFLAKEISVLGTRNENTVISVKEVIIS